MANTISVTEMLESAVQIAKNGRDYYDLAAKNVKADRGNGTLSKCQFK